MGDTSDSIVGTRAVLMAGGLGTRLRPLTGVIPKPLVPLGNRSVIDILLTQLANHGLKNITISTGYLSELIQAVCGDGSRYGLSIDYCKEDEPLGTAGALSLVKSVTNPLIVMNGDLLTTLNYRRLIQFHIDNGADVTIGMYRRREKIDFGVIDLDADGCFRGFREKPMYEFNVSMGVNVLSKAALNLIEPRKHLDMPNLILKVHAAGGKVLCYQEDCYWLDIGRMDDFATAQEKFADNQDLFLGNRTQK